MTQPLRTETTHQTTPQTPDSLRILSIIVVVLLAVVASSQQLPPSAINAEAQGRAIIAHLNSVIQFYRTVNQPIQKAGEPNDVVYRDQAVAQSMQIATLAFQAAKAQAELSAVSNAGSASAASSQQERMQTALAQADQRIASLQQHEAALDRQIASARAADLPSLKEQKQQIQSALKLNSAMKDALERIIGTTTAGGGTGLAANVDRLERSVPELQSGNKTSAPQMTTVQSALSSGVVSQAGVLFQLLEASHTLNTLIDEDNQLNRQAADLRTPLSNIIRGLIQQGQELSQAAEAPAPPVKTHPAHPQPSPAAPQPNLDSITARFKAVSAASVPLSQEVIVLGQSQANLAAWQTSIQREYTSIFHAILLRVLVIALALAMIIGGGEFWTRATNKYIRDLRRRRQLLIIRRVVVGFLSALVVLFGFVTQFNSLATFAGFITAGIAVGLQTILLSVAAYFFIIGRYGIKVGDRITIASVTGEVIDVGLVRFYLMELAGTGTGLESTGRIAVFSNAVLFQAGTPLYKQMPGTGYAWHELVVKLTDGADYKPVVEAIVQAVQGVYGGYRANIEREHEAVQSWMQASIAMPQVESRLQLSGGSFQLWTRFPVEIRHDAETDEKVTRALLDLMASNPAVKAAVATTPSIQPSVRG